MGTPELLQAMTERVFVRIFIAVALTTSLVGFVLAPIPIDADGHPDLPAPAFEQAALYRMEIALLIFYGDLLLVTPALIGLHRGRLPIEISTRGAKFAEGADQSAKLDEAAVERLEATTDDLAQELVETNLAIARLEETLERQYVTGGRFRP